MAMRVRRGFVYEYEDQSGRRWVADGGTLRVAGVTELTNGPSGFAPVEDDGHTVAVRPGFFYVYQQRGGQWNIATGIGLLTRGIREIARLRLNAGPFEAESRDEAEAIFQAFKGQRIPTTSANRDPYNMPKQVFWIPEIELRAQARDAGLVLA